MRRAVSCIVLLLSVVLLAHAQTVPTKELTSTISGKITIKGKGVPGIVVGLRSNEQRFRETTRYRAVTDANGEYRITNVPAGNYNVWPSAPAYVATDELGNKTLMVDKGETIEHVDFNLVRGGVITGKILDADGRPMIEEDVFVMPVPAKGGSSRMYHQPMNVRTDDRGVYRMYGLPAGPYNVAAGRDEENSYPGERRTSYKRTYHPATLDVRQATVIEVSEGSESANVDITLSRTANTYSVSGRIVDADTGEPLSGLNYGVTHFVNPNYTSSWSNGQGSNVRGEFKVDGLVPGQYSITLRPMETNDWRGDSVRFEVVDQDITGLVIKARKGASISGFVVLEGNEDKAIRELLNQTGLTASVSGEMGDRPWSNWTKLGPDGSFRVGGLQAGVASFFFPNSSRFRIARVEHNGVVLPRGVELREGQQLTGVRVIVSYANASLRGVITVENGTVPENGRFFAQIRKAGDESRYGNSETTPQVDSRGLFLIEGLMPGPYVLTVGLFIPGDSPTFVDTKQDVMVTGGITTNITVTLDLKAGRRRP